MPCSTFPIDAVVGPLIDLGVSAPRSLVAAEAPAPIIHWIKAIADTGCSDTCVHTNVATLAGLSVISKGMVSSAIGAVPNNIYHADLFLKYTIGTSSYEFRFSDRRVGQLLSASPTHDALLGMDIFNYGLFVVNGQTRSATFCW